VIQNANGWIVYYKVEAYTASEQAGKILYDNGITPVYVSDNPVLNAQHVVFEAAKAFANGLPYHAALAGVTSAPAELLGLGDRIGKVKAGFDADLVVWDSDPLSVGATPIQVWIDGAEQFKNPVKLNKPVSSPILSHLKPFLSEESEEIGENAIIQGFSRILIPSKSLASTLDEPVTVIIDNGRIVCAGTCTDHISVALLKGTPIIQLSNGYLTPPITAFGSSLGLVEIDSQSDTQDGPFSNTWSRAVDGLALHGKPLMRAYEHGVTRAISAPSTGSIDAQGVSVGFSTGSKNALDEGGVWAEVVAAHYTLTLGAKSEKTPSISSAIGVLRNKLLHAIFSNETISAQESFSEKAYLRKVVMGELPIVLSVHSADTIAAIIRLKEDIKAARSTSLSDASTRSSKELRLVILGAAESHLVADQLAAAGIAVVLAPLLAYSQTWDQRRSLTGAPLTNGTAIDALLDAGVLVAIGASEVWETRDLRWMAGWAWNNRIGKLSEEEALALVGRNIYKALGLKAETLDEFLIWEGSPLEIQGRLRGRAVGDYESFLQASP
jgi:imidazolonepropionase-like amidohydrolase